MKKTMSTLAIFLSTLMGCGSPTETIQTTKTVDDNIYSAVLSTNGDGNWTLSNNDGFESVQVFQNRIEVTYSGDPITSLSFTTNETLAYNHYFANGHTEENRIIIYLTRDGLTGYYNPNLLTLDASIYLLAVVE